MRRACIKGCTDVNRPCWTVAADVYTCKHGRAPEWHLADEKTHRCNTCRNTYPNCIAAPDDIEFGTGVGNDNVVYCKRFERESEIKIDTLRGDSPAELDRKLAHALNEGWKIIGDIRTIHLPNCKTPIIHYVTLRKEE